VTKVAIIVAIVQKIYKRNWGFYDLERACIRLDG